MQCTTQHPTTASVKIANAPTFVPPPSKSKPTFIRKERTLTARCAVCRLFGSRKTLAQGCGVPLLLKLWCDIPVWRPFFYILSICRFIHGVCNLVFVKLVKAPNSKRDSMKAVWKRCRPHSRETISGVQPLVAELWPRNLRGPFTKRGLESHLIAFCYRSLWRMRGGRGWISNQIAKETI